MPSFTNLSPLSQAMQRKAALGTSSREYALPEGQASALELANLLSGLLPASLPAKAAAVAKGLPGLMAAGVIKNKGGNWLSGSVEDALRGLKRGMPNLAADLGAADPVRSIPEQSINSWIDKQLTRYVKNEMATPEDPVRALAERGVLHYDPAQHVWALDTRQASGNRFAGNWDNPEIPTELTGESTLARLWEQVTDSGIDPKRVGENFRNYMRGSPDESWLAKVPDDSMVYRVADYLPPERRAPHFGFDHLIDELSNSLNPQSGLPSHLQLNPQSLQRMGVPQAVQRVSEINAWRAAQKAEADAARANNAATVLHKEYPENNPRGLRWVELKSKVPDTRTSTWDEATKSSIPMSKEALESQQALQDALKYEGDTMGHCVGGYCDDVLSGRSRIFSLRDDKGRPHVTVETAPMKAGYLTEPSEDPSAAIPDRIVQIKGKGNAKPADEYLPYVQDFVKSGNWSSVGDLENSGLFNIAELANARAPSGLGPDISKEISRIYPSVKGPGGGATLSSSDLGTARSQFDLMRELVGDRTGYMTRDEIMDWLRSEPARDPAAGYTKSGFASGGPVRTASHLRAIMAQLRQEHSNV